MVKGPVFRQLKLECSFTLIHIQRRSTTLLKNVDGFKVLLLLDEVVIGVLPDEKL